MTLGKTRLRRIAHHFVQNGTPPAEERGGKRRNATMMELRQKVVEFIKTLSVRDCHYSRSKSTRQYLPPELNIEKLYKMWKEKYSTVLQRLERTPSLQFFKNIFHSRFNLGFGLPATDQCSLCKQLEIRIESNDKEAKYELALHKLRAKKFHQLMKESRDRCDTVSLVFDMQQNQALPKTGIGEEYYKRQIWLYNLAFVIHEKHQRPSNIRFYTWGEQDTGRGCNEICSALMNCLHRLRKRVERRKYTRLDLFADSCPGQNKNNALLCMLLQYVNTPSCPFKEIRVIFPVRGHSYMPADAVFGRLEQQYRKQSSFITPDDYYAIMKRFGYIRKYNEHWRSYDYKHMSEILRKGLPHIPIRESKIWFFKKNHREVGISMTYSGAPQIYKHGGVASSRRGRNATASHSAAFFVKPRLARCESHISAAKVADVKSLLQFTRLNADQKNFYDLVLSKESKKTCNQYGGLATEVKKKK